MAEACSSTALLSTTSHKGKLSIQLYHKPPNIASTSDLNVAKLNTKAGGALSPMVPSVWLTVLQTLTLLCLYLWVNIWVKDRTTVAPTEGALKLCGSLRSANAYPGTFFGPLCRIMTEWERSHRDKREGGRERGQEEETDEGGGKRGLWIDVIWVSVMIATEGQPGYGLIQWQTITELMGG